MSKKRMTKYSCLNAMQALEPDYPTGAWGMTAEHARRLFGRGGPSGCDGSRHIVELNRKRKVPTDYWQRLAMAANAFDIPAVILCAIADRESNQGGALDARGYGDGGHGFGVCQVDGRSHHLHGTYDPFSLVHLEQAAAIFAHFLRHVANAHSSWPDKYILKGALVAYNAGLSSVRTIARMDVGSTNNDYGADTAARAQYLYDLTKNEGA